jgi:phage terminase small subunit
MPGRRAKPLSLHISGGNKSHLTAQEISDREKSEIKFGDFNFKPTARLRQNKTAHKKWREIISLYRQGNVDFVTTSDSGMIERYCLTYAEYYGMLDVVIEIEARGMDKTATQQFIDGMGLGASINKKLDALTKMEDRLFLNPLAKIRNVPKPAEKKQIDPLQQAGFGNI